MATNKFAEDQAFVALSKLVEPHHEELLRIDQEIQKLEQRKALVKMAAINALASSKDFRVSKEIIDFVAVC